VAKRVFSDYPCFGHYDTWDIDLLQSLLEKNTGKLLYSGWRNVTDYIKTEESSVTVPIHNENLQKAVDEKVSQLTGNGFEPQYSQDISHLSRGMGVKIPFLPVRTKKEFHVLIMLALRCNDLMVKKWHCCG
jgi:hypothetical protein